MSELKPCPCPICGAELKINSPEDWTPTFYDPDSGGDPYNAVCDCGFSFGNGSYDYEEFIAALNRRSQPDNEPLTLEELLCLDAGEIVYCTPLNDWAKIIRWGIAFFGAEDYRSWPEVKADYGKTWLAYRCKPGGSENDAIR